MKTNSYIEELQNRIKSLETELELYRNQVLYTSEEDISRLLASRTDIVLLLDFERRIIDINPVFTKTLGWNEDELTGEKLQNYFSSKSSVRLFDIIKQFDKQNKVDSKISLKNKNGEICVIEASFTTVNYKSTKAVLIKGVPLHPFVHDKTETVKQIRELEYLSDNATKLMSFPDNSDIFKYLCGEIYRLVPNSIVITLEWNPEKEMMALKDFKGFAKLGEIISKYLGENIYGMEFPVSPEGEEHLSRQKLLPGPSSIYRIAERKIPRFLADLIEKIIGLEDSYIMGVLQNGVFFGEVIIFLRKGGSIGNVSFLETLINQASIAIQRQKTKKALAESEKKYRSVVDNANEAIFVVTEKNFQYINPTAEKISGYSREELYRMNFEDLIYEKDKILVLERYKKRLAGESIKPYDFRIIRKDGSLLWVTLNAEAIYWDGKKSTLSFVSDINEKKKAENSLIAKNAELIRTEEELRQSYDELKRINMHLQKQKDELKAAKEKAEESDRLKTAFLANMSHEIRTPMNGILGFSALLNDREISEEERNIYIETINKSGKQLLNIINDILEISKIEAGQIEIKNEEVIPAEIIDDLYRFYEPAASEKKLDFERKEPEYTDLTITCDKTKTRQILSNLLSNAFKFTPRGKVTFGWEANSETVSFFVKDTGIGIKTEHRRLIFDRFSQVEHEFSKMYGGTGLGLSISNNYAEAMGGSIEVSSEPGKGSTFILTLPKNRHQ